MADTPQRPDQQPPRSSSEAPRSGPRPSLLQRLREVKKQSEFNRRLKGARE